MKKYFPAMMAVGLSLATFISCKKDPITSNQNSNPDTIPNTVSGTYLSKLIFSYDDGSGTEFIDRITTYEFDNLKRVSKMIDSSDDNGSGLLELSQTTEYFYNGNDSLPYKGVVIANPGAQAEYDSTTDYYTYNSSGLLIRDTGFFVNHGTVYYSVSSNQTYAYAATTVTGRTDYNVVDGTSTSASVQTDTAQTDANGNIIHNIKHKQGSVINSTITWDNHPSPFAKLSNFQTFAILPFGETFFYEMPKKNNRLHITEVTSGNSPYTFDEDLTGHYTYNAEGYPAQILVPDSPSGGYDKTVFVYKSL